MDVGNDRTVFAQQCVKQGAFAGISGSGYCDRNSILYGVAEAEGIDQSGYMCDDGGEQRVES